MNVINYLRFLIIIGNIRIVCELSLWNGSDFGSRYQIEALDRNVHLNLLRKRLIGTEFVKSGKRWILEICLEKGCRVFFIWAIGQSMVSDNMCDKSFFVIFDEWQFVWWIVLCWGLVSDDCESYLFQGKFWGGDQQTFLRPDCWSHKWCKRLFTFAKLWVCFLSSCVISVILPIKISFGNSFVVGCLIY